MSAQECADFSAGGVFLGEGELAQRMRQFDWSSTELGSPDTWPDSLKSVIRMLLTTRYQMWMAWGPSLTFFCNDAYRPTLGVKFPWALGQPASKVWSEIWPDIDPLIQHVMTTGEATYSEKMLLFLERSGFAEETYHTFSYSPLFGDNGKIAGMLCVVVEETERVISERRLATLSELASKSSTAKTEPELFKNICSSLADNSRDLPFTLTYVFSGDEAHLACATGIEAGHPAAPPILTMQNSPWPLSEAYANGEIFLDEALAERHANLPSPYWRRSSRQALISPISSSGGKGGIAGFFIVGLNPFRPVDENYRSFIELVSGQISAALASVRSYEAERKRAEALAEIDRAKTNFFSNVSHEFRTPLTLMLGPLEELLAQAAPEAKQQIELAHRNGLRLLRLVNALLDFSRIEAGRTQARFAPTDIAETTAEIASEFRSAFERAGLYLKVESEPLPEPVFVDADMWEKVVLNLLSNAFKYTFVGGATVRIRRAPNAEAVDIEVRDTGTGIAPHQLPKLFERFHRIEGARSRSIEGTGIGLALVQELVKLHGGSISVSSEPENGTAFTIRLPFGSDHLPQNSVFAESLPKSPQIGRAYMEEALRWLPDGEADENMLEIVNASPIEQRDGIVHRVILADDNGDMRDYVSRLLETRGFRVDAFPNGVEALEAARAQRPDLILSDVMMPGMDGFALLHAIRADSALAGVPVILLSARAGEEARIEGLEEGADDYLTKPFTARELIARVTANIQLAQMRRDVERELLRNETKLQMTQDRLELALSSGRITVFETDVQADRAIMLGPLTSAFGVGEIAASKGLQVNAYLPAIHEDDRARVDQAVRQAIETGSNLEEEYRVGPEDDLRHVAVRGKVIQGPDGPRLVGAIIDITQEKSVERELRNQKQALEILNKSSSTVAADIELEQIVQTITEAGLALSAAEFGAFFYNVLNDAGESYMLYTLAGVPKDSFDDFPMPRNTSVFAPTFNGEGIVRSDDITKDPRYGKNDPHNGMPNGHLPVRSYLASPVRSRSGEVLGGLFFGHSSPAMFSSRTEDLIGTLAAQAAVAIDNARLFQASERELHQRRKAERELSELNAGLEKRVNEEVGNRLQAEAALRQAQKMEAVGQLTGGVAHDFNNLLTVILGGLDTLRRGGVADNPRWSRALATSMQGVQRAATLTARLLAFSRRQPLDPKPLDLNTVVRDSTDLLHRTMGELVEIEGVLAPRLWLVEADQNQLETAIVNLAINARDAMPSGGKMTIETGNVYLDEAYAATDAEVVPGQYVMIAVSDNGEGMSEEVLARAFEPFFTTKETGKGTGLGLSMIYGFVKQSGGHITIYSEENHGTTVKMYFPRYTGTLPLPSPTQETKTPQGSKDECILVVEDNAEVRANSVMILSELGYSILEAAEAEAALEIISGPQKIDLLFTDVVLPGKSGRQLSDEARKLRPDLKVLFTTGYSRNALVHQGRLDTGVNLISKPFTFEQLAARIRAILD
ncbi:ATP-binding protein [Hyphomicrobium sp.]|uniref:ATP-binding protein n=1 Tax=Hyphomicrobium sp. TaxID=82 RepID=UPI000F9D642B|nr:ATP-binding protein [Hyphomicrobium sp.]RUP00538.1 MAG: response regulator [Hyphomicrobium sp.]